MVPKYWKRLDEGNRFWHNMTCPYLQIIFMVLLWPIRSHFSLNQIIKVWKIGWSNGRQSGRLDTSRPLRPAYPILSCLAMVYGSVFCRHLLWPLILAHPEVVYVIFKRYNTISSWKRQNLHKPDSKVYFIWRKLSFIIHGKLQCLTISNKFQKSELYGRIAP